jgi:alkaline phosphatase D
MLHFIEKGFVSRLSLVTAVVTASSCTVRLAGGRAGEAVYVQSGDVRATSAVVWVRCNREMDARLRVELWEPGRYEQEGDHEREHDDGAYEKGDVRSIRGPRVGAKTDYTGSVQVHDLEPGEAYLYRARCEATGGRGTELSRVGLVRTAPAPRAREDVRFVWAADLAGQGWGRNPELSITDAEGETIEGGYVVFEVMRKLDPDFALFAGDVIYADNPIPAEKALPAELGGGNWINDPTKDFVALSLADYRENWKYNLDDGKLQDFLLETPMYSQWDDHEVTNNWYPGETLLADPYNGLEANVLAELSRQALFEYNPIAGHQIYRKFRHGKHLELFLLDERSFRGPNPDNSEPAGIEMLGARQFRWLKCALKRSDATWKVISTHDPLSIVTGGPGDHDAWAQGEPEVLGREVQLAELLKFIKDEHVENVVFLTADVHFAAAIAYEPTAAVFGDFKAFWEFVIGPVHAGAFGAKDLDASFGPAFEYVRAPSTEGLPQNSPPPNLQSFGAVEVSEDGVFTVRIHDLSGDVLFEKVMSPKS